MMSNSHPDNLTRLQRPLLVPQTRGTDFGNTEARFIHGVVDSEGHSEKPYYHHMRRDEALCNQELLTDYLSNHQALPLSGRWLYAGGLFNHFGHFLSECCHRLWAWRYHGHELDGLIFLSKPGHESLSDLPDFITRLLSLLNIPTDRVKLINELTRVEELLVPAPGQTLLGTPQTWYRAEIDTLLDQEKLPTTDYPEKIIMSRAGNQGTGRVLGLSVLEQTLEAEGYSVIRPETIPIELQFGLVLNARTIIWEEGSAIHLLDLLPKIEADSFLISRRPFFPMFAEILESKSATSTHFKDVITLTDITRNDTVRYNSMAILTHPQTLSEYLRNSGFIKAIPDDFSEQYYCQELHDLAQYLQTNEASSQERLAAFCGELISSRGKIPD